MKKLKLLAVSKNEERCQFSFPKEQQFFAIIRELLYKLNFTDEQSLNFGMSWNEKEYCYSKKEEDIQKYIDIITYFSNEEYSVDIIFGKNKVFLIIHSKEDKQQLISKYLDEFIKN